MDKLIKLARCWLHFTICTLLFSLFCSIDTTSFQRCAWNYGACKYLKRFLCLILIDCHNLKKKKSNEEWRFQSRIKKNTQHLKHGKTNLNLSSIWHVGSLNSIIFFLFQRRSSFNINECKIFSSKVTRMRNRLRWFSWNLLIVYVRFSDACQQRWRCWDVAYTWHMLPNIICLNSWFIYTQMQIESRASVLCCCFFFFNVRDTFNFNII